MFYNAEIRFGQLLYSQIRSELVETKLELIWVNSQLVFTNSLFFLLKMGWWKIILLGGGEPCVCDYFLFHRCLSAGVLFLFLHVANNTEFGIFDKVDDLVNMFALGNLFTNLDDGVFHAEVSSIDESVGIGDVA